jgi:hypothetical protein
LYIDGVLRFENWCDNCGLWEYVNISLSQGVHLVVMTLWENQGWSSAALTYSLTDAMQVVDPNTQIADGAAERPDDLVLVTNAGARVRWVFNGQQGQGQSNPVSNPANYKQIYLPVMIRQASR